MPPEPAHDLVVIKGGRPLRGRVRIGGSKNASLPIMAACLLTKDQVRLQNLARIADTRLMQDMLRQLGVRLEVRGGDLVVEASQVKSHVPDELARRMRASIVLLGALIARTGQARLHKPGGDAIGARRVEQHLRALRAMGAEITETTTEFVARVKDRLRGARVVLDLPTVTGTENVIMAAVLAEGRTEIYNAAREPHVQDLCRFLVAAGARIRGAGTDEIVIDGVERLHGVEHRIVPDYLEAGTYAIAAAATGGDVLIEHSPPEDLPSLVLKLQEAGVEVDTGPGWMRVRRDPARPLRAVDMVTWVHPGFPTDLQAQYLALMTQAVGDSVISEYLHDNRFQHVTDLTRMGARITVAGKDAFVRGPARLHGTDVTAPDIRSGAALVIGALCAQGTTELSGAWHIDRGYEDMPGKLRALGADIRRVAAASAQAVLTASFE